MPSPLIEQIAAAVQTAIEAVTVDNGYQVTISSVVRPTRLGGYVPDDWLVILNQGPWRPDERNSPFGVVRRIVPFMAEVMIRPSDEDATPIDTYINLAISDIEKALVADRSLGGLAQSLEILPPVIFVNDDGAFDGVGINFEVAYRHSQGDPYTAA